MNFKFLNTLLLIALFSSCVDFDRSTLNNLHGQVKVIGHGGSGFYSWVPFNSLPANSLGSIQKALNNGADGIEVDVHMTADKQFVLYHDNLLESKTNKFGCPSNYNLDDLEKLKYSLGIPFDWFQDERLIGLERLIQELKKRDQLVDLHLDLRNHSQCHDDPWDKMWEGILLEHLHTSLIKWEYPADKIYLISFSKELISHALEKKLPYHISFEIAGDPEGGLQFIEENKIHSATVKPSILTKEMSSRLHENGVEVITFGARSKSGNKKLLQLNPDIIQTNNVNALKDLLRN